MKTRRLSFVVLLALVAGACGGGSGSAERSVLVDFSSDEFASSAFLNVPGKVTVKPGSTIVFRQTWTGEPHTVTGGTSVNEPLAKGQVWLDFFESFDALGGAGLDLPDPENPGDATWPDAVKTIKGGGKAGRAFIDDYNALIKSGVDLPSIDNPPAVSFGDVSKKIDELSEAAFEGIRFAFDEETENIAQNMGQPCYLRTGEPPDDKKQACPKENQSQPEFDGKYSFYNSGIIRYEGNDGNTFRVKLADDIAPGTYTFYCAIHGPQQRSEIVVADEGDDVPSSGDVARDSRREMERVLKPLREIYRDARDNNQFRVQGEELKGPFAGLYSPEISHALINEFIPKQIRAKANEPITWKMLGSDHSISFGVPRYFPIIEFQPNNFRINPALSEPAGGAPAIPEQEGEGVLKVDGGTYSGSGFWSSGLLGAEPYAEYTLRIAKAGTYNYACLIHPPMVGKITIT